MPRPKLKAASVTSPASSTHGKSRSAGSRPLFTREDVEVSLVHIVPAFSPLIVIMVFNSWTVGSAPVAPIALVERAPAEHP